MYKEEGVKTLSSFLFAFGILVIAAFIYFARPGDTSKSMANHTAPVIDSTSSVAAEAAAEKRGFGQSWT